MKSFIINSQKIKKKSKDKKELVQLGINNKVRQEADKIKIKKVRNKTKSKYQRENVSNIKSSVNSYIKQNTDINVDNLGLNNINDINLGVNENIPKIKSKKLEIKQKLNIKEKK